MPLPPAITSIRALSCLLTTAAVALGGVAVADVGTASASPTGPSVVRLAAGHQQVGYHGHVWQDDRRFATGGHLVRVAPGHHVPAKYRVARAGRFSYRLDVEPGSYTIRADVIGPRHRSDAATADIALRRPTSRPLATVAGHQVYRVQGAARTISGHLRLTFRAGSEVLRVSVVRCGPVGTSGTPTSGTPTSGDPTSGSPTSGDPTSGSPTSGSPTSGSPTAGGTTGVPDGDVTPEDFGAAGNGTTDDTAALQKTFDDADGRPVYLPAGHVYAHDAVLQLRVAGLQVTGPGELLATNEQYSSVWIAANDVTVDGIDIATQHTTQRWVAYEQMGLRLEPFSGITVSNVTVDGSAAAGIYVGGAHDFVLDHDTVENTRADGIHMTEGAYDGQVISPVTRNTGDDGVAIVSYAQDPTRCHDITVSSPTVLGNTWGRGLTVLGGYDITETNIDVQDTSAAGVYIGAEGSPWYTYAAQNITVTGGSITDANQTASVDHGAVLVISAQTSMSPSDITVSNLTITDTRSTASRDIGVVDYGSAPSSVLYSHLTITGGPQWAYGGNAPQSSYELRSITQNGKALPDQG